LLVCVADGRVRVRGDGLSPGTDRDVRRRPWSRPRPARLPLVHRGFRRPRGTPCHGQIPPGSKPSIRFQRYDWTRVSRQFADDG
jgi:hypothetical protein